MVGVVEQERFGMSRSHLPSWFACFAAAFALVAALASDATGAVPTCFGMPATIIGTSGHDSLPGTSGDDVIVGLGGKDWIGGRGGNDRICGGGGNDNADEVDYGEDPPGLYGGSGNDMIDGGPGYDDVSGSGGVDLLKGGGGPDWVCDGFCYRDFWEPEDSSGPDDRLIGGAGNDGIYATGGDDVVEGGRGNDHLGGLSGLLDLGSDKYYGGAGNDEIYSVDTVGGNDKVFGGSHNSSDGCLADTGDAVSGCERTLPPL